MRRRGACEVSLLGGAGEQGGELGEGALGGAGGGIGKLKGLQARHEGLGERDECRGREAVAAVVAAEESNALARLRVGHAVLRAVLKVPREGRSHVHVGLGHAKTKNLAGLENPGVEVLVHAVTKCRGIF